jgi:hypothetical protein
MSDTRHLDLDALCTETADCDEVFTLLSNSRRRSVLYVLYQADGDLDLSELVRRVASCETGTPAAELDDDVTQSMYISLYQTHIPKLDDFGLVTYDDDNDERTVSLTPRARDALVTADQRTTRNWHRYYATLLVGGILAGVAAWMLNGTASWQLVSVGVLIGLGGVVVADAQSGTDAEIDGSLLALADLV